jgi:hypothetical protein
MITASSQIERIHEPLPLVEADPEKQMELFQKSLHSLIKKQAVNVVSGQTIDFSEDVRHFVKMIWDNGYSKGLAHMDKMHQKIDKELNNG